MRPAPGETPAQLIERLETVYHAPDSMLPRDPRSNTGVMALYREWGLGEPCSPGAKAAFHTEYHKREKTVGAAIGDW